MKILWIGLVCVFLTTSAFGQLTARNPVDELKDQVTQVLTDAKVPFTPDQEKQLALLIEEERQAAENLFGVTWDFSNGPPQGEQRDQALAGIQWMYDELKKKLPAYMTDAQRAAWEKYELAARSPPLNLRNRPKVRRTAAAEGKIQQIRVTNNAFNVETATASGARWPAIGAAQERKSSSAAASGAFHGNFASTFQRRQT